MKKWLTVNLELLYFIILVYPGCCERKTDLNVFAKTKGKRLHTTKNHRAEQKVRALSIINQSLPKERDSELWSVVVSISGHQQSPNVSESGSTNPWTREKWLKYWWIYHSNRLKFSRKGETSLSFISSASSTFSVVKIINCET